MSEFKGTKGPVRSGEVYYRSHVGSVTVIESVDGCGICEVYGSVDEEPLANVDLIAESFNVLHETGMRPRELVQKMQQLEKDAERYRKMRDANCDIGKLRSIVMLANDAMDSAVDAMEATPE